MLPMLTFRRLVIAMFAGLALAPAGCSKFDLRKGIPWTPGADGELERPMKIAASWTDTVMSHGDEVPVRGFGGRLMFYAREDAKPVKVKGSLVVYAFDETGRDPRNVRPNRKFVFSEEEFDKHHSESKIGHAYSIWLPWDRVGGPQAEISLLVRFTPKDGGMVTGEQQTVLLPGAAVPNPSQAPYAATGNAMRAPMGGVQQASYMAPVGGYQAAAGYGAIPSLQPQMMPMAHESKRMTTTTIPLDARPGNRLPTTTGAAFQGAPAATPGSNSQPVPAWMQQGLPESQSSAHFGPGRLRPLGAPIARLDRDRGPWRPTHAAPPSAAAGQPQ
jgi:hypothetical protein